MLPRENVGPHLTKDKLLITLLMALTLKMRSDIIKETN